MTLEWLDKLSNNELKSLTTELIQDITVSGKYDMGFDDEELIELRQNSEFANETIIKYYKLSKGK